MDVRIKLKFFTIIQKTWKPEMVLLRKKDIFFNGSKNLLRRI